MLSRNEKFTVMLVGFGSIVIVIMLIIAVFDGFKTEPKPPADNEPVVIGISVGEEGYYSIMADVEYEYFNDEISAIYLDNTRLLAFKVSEYWDGGAMIYDYSNIEAIIKKLREMGLDDIADELERGMLLTEAST